MVVFSSANPKSTKFKKRSRKVKKMKEKIKKKKIRDNLEKNYIIKNKKIKSDNLSKINLEKDKLENEELNKLKRKIKIYGEGVINHLPNNNNINKLNINNNNLYVPKFKLSIDQVNDTPKSIDRIIRGLLNKLTEFNIETITNQIINLYSNFPRYNVNTSLLNCIFSTLYTETVITSMFTVHISALIFSVHSQMDLAIGKFLLKQITKNFFINYSSKDSEDYLKSSKLMILITYLYYFSMIHSNFMYELMSLLVKSFKETDIDLLYTLLKTSGYKLRKDNPAKFKEFFILFQNMHCSNNKNIKKEITKLNTRIDIITNFIITLKNHTSKVNDIAFEKVKPLKKWIGNIIKKKVGGHFSDRIIDISINELLTGKTNCENLINKNKEVVPTKLNTLLFKNIDSYELLLNKHKIYSPIKKTIFCLIVSSVDFFDAFKKLLKFMSSDVLKTFKNSVRGNLSHIAEHEIINVIIECCMKEKIYNPFYSLLIRRLSEYKKSFKFTLKLAFWDYFKKIKTEKSLLTNVNKKRNIINLSNMLSYLIINKTLNLNMLKDVNWYDLDCKSAMNFFLIILFSELIVKMKSFREVLYSQDIINEEIVLFLNKNAVDITERMGWGIDKFKRLLN